MMEFFKQLHHLEPYGNPQYFVYVIAATLPIFIGLFFKKRFAWYEVLVSLFFIVTMLVGGNSQKSKQRLRSIDSWLHLDKDNRKQGQKTN